MKNKLSLVEKAKSSIDPRIGSRIYSEEEIELVLAWATGEITISQLSRAANLRSVPAAYPFIANALRQWILDGSPV